MSRHLLGVDAGGTYIKTTLFDEVGHPLFTAKQVNNTVLLSGGRCERDPGVMMSAVYRTIDETITGGRIGAHEVAGLAVTGFGCGLWLLDEHGEPLHHGIVSTDSRANELIASLPGDLSRHICQRVSSRMFGGLTLPLMLWMSHHEPELVERTASVVACKDFIRGQLTGDYSTDESDAGFTGLCDLSTKEWAWDVLDALGIPEWMPKLPRIGDSTEVVGTLTPGAARRSGLPASTPVVRGVLDVTACALASGIDDTSKLLVIAGTFGNNQMMHQDRPRTSTPPLAQAPYLLPDSYLATEGGPTSASNLEWFLRRFAAPEHADDQTWADTVSRCNEWVSRAYGQPERSETIFLPYVFDGPGGAPAGLIGMAAKESLPDLVLPVYEGIAFAHRRNIEALLTGDDATPPSLVRLAGGGSNSLIWPQIFADTLNLPIEIPDCPEMGALGSAIVAAVGVGIYPSMAEALLHMTRIDRSYEPDVARAGATTDRYHRHVAVTEALAGSWTATRPSVASR